MSRGLPLEGERIRLREHVDSDLEAMHRWRGDPHVMRFLSWGSASLEDTRASLDDAIAEQARRGRERWFLAVELRETGEMIGDVGFTLGPGGREASIGWFLCPEHHGNGHGTEAAQLLLELASGELGVRRVTAGCAAENRASERVMQKVGMRRVDGGGGPRVEYAIELR